MQDTVLIQGNPIWKEGEVGSTALVAGKLVQYNSGSSTLEKKVLDPHSTADGTANKMFTTERDWVGDTIDTLLATGEQIPYIVAHQGDVVFAFLEIGGNVLIGAPLSSDGAGNLQAPTLGTAQPNSIVAYAYEALNNLTGSPARIRVEVA